MLLAIKQYLKNADQISLKDVALHFDIPEGVAEDMIQHWIDKGFVKAVEDNDPNCTRGACGGCHSHCCEASFSEKKLYHWVKN